MAFGKEETEMLETRKPLGWCLTILNHLVITAVAFICLYPMIHVLAASFSDPRRLLMHTGVLFWPDGYSLKGYITVLNSPNILMGYGNTLFYVVVGTAVNMLLTSLGAYALARAGWPFRKPFVFMFVFTMYFNVGIIPMLLMVKRIGLYDSRWAMILPTAINTWNMIVMRTAFSAIPSELQESAFIDGATDIRILFQIYFPVAKATMAVMFLFYAVDHWNSWFPALLYLQDKSKHPLQMFVRDILLYDAAAGMTDDAEAIYLKQLSKFAVVIIAAAPILCIYPFVQRFFVKGIMLGSVKG